MHVGVAVARAPVSAHPHVAHVWLRDNSPHASTVYRGARTNSRLLSMRELSIDVRPLRVGVSADGTGVHIEWPGGIDVVYDIDWLNQHDHTNDNVHACHLLIEIGCRCILSLAISWKQAWRVK